jgi:hypothetical protein
MMEMSKMYTDHMNQIAIAVPEQFIDVRTGESVMVSSKIQEQIDYHAYNGTLIHLVLSALNNYFHSKQTSGGSEEVLMELSEIKRMLQQGHFTRDPHAEVPLNSSGQGPMDIDINEVEDILDVFGG